MELNSDEKAKESETRTPSTINIITSLLEQKRQRHFLFLRNKKAVNYF